jgi:hypothetical protein
MSTEPYKSAWIFDRLVQAMNEFVDIKDRSFATQELAIGSPLAVRPVDLCFGLAEVEPQQTSNKHAPIVMGLGVGRIGGTSASTVISAMAIEQGYSADTLMNISSASNCYAFGSVFLTSSQPSMGSYPLALSLKAALLCGGVNQSGTPLLIQRSIDTPTAVDLFASGKLGVPLVPWTGSENTGTRSAIEIGRFVLDIDTYAQNNAGGTSISTEYIDLRRLRGWLGFPDDVLASTLTPTLISTVLKFSSDSSSLSSQVYNVISEWSTLSSWTPSFISYWTTNAQYMRPTLKAYLYSALGISLP